MINKQPLIKFLIWNSILFLICFIGSSNVFALETETIYSDNSNCTFSNSGKYKNVSSNGTISTNNVGTTYQGKSYGMQFFFAEDMLTTKVYQLKITFMSNDLLPRVNENFIELVTYDTSCESDYATILSIEKNTTSGNATTIQINFIPTMTSNKARILIGSSTGPIQITGETNFGIRNVQIGDRESQGNEQIIINQNQNANNIMNNQNENNQKLLESQQVCETIDNSSKDIDNKYLNSSGQEVGNTSYIITKYIKLSKDSELKTISSQSSNSTHYCFYNTNKVLISCSNLSTLVQGELVAIPSNAEYFRSSILKEENRPTFKLCKNGNQAVSDSVNDLNNNITDSNIDDSDIGNYFDDFNDFLDDNSTITQLITLPVTLYTAILTNLNGTCSPFNLGRLYGSDLILPCINISQYLGSALWTMIDIIISGFAIFAISKKFIKVFNSLSSLREGDVIDD